MNEKTAPQPESPAASLYLKTESNSQFEDVRVLLDGTRFINCKFTNAIFMWNGGIFSIEGIVIDGSVGFSTENQTVANAVDVLKALGFLNQQFAESWRQ